MAYHIGVKKYFRPQDNTTQAMLAALPIPTKVISTRITMVADNPRNGIAHKIADIITTEAVTLHWALDQVGIDHLMVLGSIVDNTSSWRYGTTSTGCCRVAFNTMAVSHAATDLRWDQHSKWQQQFGTAPTESEAVIYNMITELTAQHQRRLERVEAQLKQRSYERVNKLTAAAHRRAEQKVKEQMAAKIKIIERFRDTGTPTTSIANVIRDPVYRFTLGIANSQITPENTGTDK